MTKKIKGQKADTQTFSFAGDNKKNIMAIKKIAAKEDRDLSWVLNKILDNAPEIKAHI